MLSFIKTAPIETISSISGFNPVVSQSKQMYSSANGLSNKKSIFHHLNFFIEIVFNISKHS